MKLQRRSRWLVLLLTTGLLACAGYGPSKNDLGISRAELVQRMGPPDQERQVGGVTRLEFPRGPMGRHTWFVYLDAAGRVARWEQALTEANFTKVLPGMGDGDVSLLLGRPSERTRLARQRGDVWSYRYENNACLWFQVEMSAEHQVRSAGYGTPPECELRDSPRD